MNSGGDPGNVADADSGGQGGGERLEVREVTLMLGVVVFAPEHP